LKEFDIIVVGGGHAGIESAWLASQFEVRVGMVTMNGVEIGSTPCNPSIGGVGKGQVVREIDCLGGLMGKVADRSGIQYRTLNESKGYAVQSTRVQVDKDLYAQYATEEIEENERIELIRGKVVEIEHSENLKTFTITLSSGDQFLAKKLIITTGTFLKGKLHRGEEVKNGGRVSCEQSPGMEELFPKVGRLRKRFKTGTPPRIDRETINYSSLVEQKSDRTSQNFHWAHDPKKRIQEQLSCYIAHTNSNTLSTIRENKEKSPIFNGQISGVGPRYCPSIEDKAFRYLDRDIHHVFIEPEGLQAATVYPNGVSTSLPKEIQQEFIRSIVGLEKAKILVYGYAVEYDVVDTTELRETLEHKKIQGLYFAGQVCGTSGYEEAAGQGVIAGINSALSCLGREEFILGRTVSYIGVMVQDLVTNVRDEPYRLFTARAENRLTIREDNALVRISGYRKALGLDMEIDRYQSSFMAEYELLLHLVENYRDRQSKMSLSSYLRQSDRDPINTLLEYLENEGLSFTREVIRTVAISCLYDGYITRSHQEIEKFEKYSRKMVQWEALIENSNISNECRARISKVRPENFGQLRNIEGIRPATVAFVAGTLR